MERIRDCRHEPEGSVSDPARLAWIYTWYRIAWAVYHPYRDRIPWADWQGRLISMRRSLLMEICK